MALCVVRIKDRTHPDPLVSQILYRAGDVVDVLPDREIVEAPVVPHWAYVQITGLSVDRAKRLLVQRDMTEEFQADGELHPRLRRMRLRSLALDLVPAAVRRAVLVDRCYVTTAAAVRNYLRNKLTNELEPLE